MSGTELSRSIAATLTPSGRGAVAVIGIRGPLAETALARHFQHGGGTIVARSVSEGETTGWLGSNEVSPQRAELGASLRSDPSHPRLAATSLRRILYGTWQPRDRAAGPREDVVLTRFETHWELGCHGGVIAATAILGDLAAAGLENVTWQEWLAATSRNRLAASAAVALATANSPAVALALLRASPLTENALLELLDSFSGPRSGSSLRSSPATPVQSESLRSSPATPVAEAMTQAAIEGLLSTARWARKLTASWNIVLAGLPNAGKSSLLNALVGYERAIVFNEPGTTRDVVTAAAAYDGWRWELHDTAGLRATADSLEAAGIERTTTMLVSSDVTVLVIDGTRPWSESAELRRAHPTAIIVCNKSDLGITAPTWEGEAPAEPLLDNHEHSVSLTPALSRLTAAENTSAIAGEAERRTPLAVSAVTGHGLEELRAAIHVRLALPAWDAVGVCVWDAALEHDLRTLQHVLRDDPAALPVAVSELRTWIA